MRKEEITSSSILSCLQFVYKYVGNTFVHVKLILTRNIIQVSLMRDVYVGKLLTSRTAYFGDKFVEW